MDLEQYKIIHLPKEQWKNVCIPMRYTTEQYYDVKIQRNNDCFHIELIGQCKKVCVLGKKWLLFGKN